MSIYNKNKNTPEALSNDKSPSNISPNSSKKKERNPFQVDFDILSNMDRAQFIDPSINKFYTKYLQKQAFIQHEQKLYDLIEKSNEPKIFNSLRTTYLKEQNELKNMNNIIKARRKVTDNISSVNLSNCNKKLYAIYKLSGDDLGFMTSFMHHLGNRPEKVYKPKVNKKIEALSMGKSGNLIKNKDKDKKNRKYSLKTLLKKLENENPINNNVNNNINNKIEENKLVEKSESKNEVNDFNINKTNNNINYNNGNNNNNFRNKQLKKKNTVSINTKTIKLFRNERITNPNVTNYSSKKYVNNIKKYSVNYNELYHKYVSKSKEASQNEESKEEKKTEINNNNNYRNYYLKTSKFNNIITTSDTVNTINTIPNIRDSIINKVEINTNINTNINVPKEKEKEKKLSLININIEDSVSNENEKKTEKENADSLINIQKENINNNEEKSKILKMYKTSMNEFLQKVKQEGNILNRTSHKLSSLLYKLKRENFETFQNERNKNKNNFLNQRNYKTSYNQSRVQENLGKKKFGKTFYKHEEKSRFRIPYINKVIYGDNNFYDPFERLQKELFTEVKREIKNAENINKKRKKKVVNVVGVDILNKLIREDSDDELKKELFEMNKIQNQNQNNNPPVNKTKNKSNSKINEINKSSNKKII